MPKTTRTNPEETVIFKFSGLDAIEKIKAKIREAVAGAQSYRLVVTNREGRVLFDASLAAPAIGVALAPVLAAIAAIAVVSTECEVKIMKRSAGAKK